LKSRALADASNQAALAVSGATIYLRNAFYSTARAEHVWGLSRSFDRAAHLFSFVSLFVRSESPFLRPDPRFAYVGARRSCQGWPPRQPCGTLCPCQATP